MSAESPVRSHPPHLPIMAYNEHNNEAPGSPTLSVDKGPATVAASSFSLLNASCMLGGSVEPPAPPSQADRLRLTIPRTVIPAHFKSQLPAFLFESNIGLTGNKYPVFFAPVRRLTSKGHMVDRLVVVDKSGVFTLYEDSKNGASKRVVDLKSALLSVYEDGEYLVLHIKNECDLCLALRRSVGGVPVGATPINSSTNSVDEEGQTEENIADLQASTAFWANLLPRSFPKMMAVFSFFASDYASFYTVRNAPSFATKLNAIRVADSEPPTPEPESEEEEPTPPRIPTPPRAPTPVIEAPPPHLYPPCHPPSPHPPHLPRSRRGLQPSPLGLRTGCVVLLEG